MAYRSPNKHYVAEEIKRGKADGRYKDCANLTIGVYGRFYVATCEERSLLHPPEQDPRGEHPSLCPADCHFFADRLKVESKQRWEGRKRRWLSRISIPVRWFSAAPEEMQLAVLIIFGFVVIGLVAPTLIDKAADLLRAYQGAP